MTVKTLPAKLFLYDAGRSVVGAQVVHIDFPWKDAAEPWKVPKANSNYHRNLMDKGWRTSLKPLNIDQPEGPSFTVRPCSI